MSEQQKWSCDYCTYENYQSSQKCIMCKGLKPTVNEDIFRISPPNIEEEEEDEEVQEKTTLLGTTSKDDDAVEQDEGQTNGPFKNQETSSIKWSCNSCTYLNWPKSQYCVQCLTSRSSTNAADDLNNEDLLFKPETTETQQSFDQLATVVNSHSSKSDTLIEKSNFLKSSILKSPIGSITNLASSRGAVGTNYQTKQPSSTASKWICHVCTYENWPRSLKCCMCGDERNTDPNYGDTINSDGCAGIDSTLNDVANFSEKLYDHDLSTKSLNNKNRYQLGSLESNCDLNQEQQERKLRHIKRQVDWQWLNACLGVVDNNYSAVETYLTCGGSSTRSLTSAEVAILNKNSAFNAGDTLMHVAIRFRREEMLPMLLAQFSGSGPGIKRVPSYIAPDLAADIRRYFANTLRVRKSIFNCHYVNEHATFSLPSEIEELPMPIQEQLYDELLDRDAQKQLENPPPVLNWSIEITSRLGSRLLCLWNRSAGDCLLDSAMQATWGVFDRENTLRRALADSLHQCSHIFYPRWKEYEELQASILHFTLEETQWEEDWTTLLSLASQPGSSLEALHIFALAHILRRPIIVYGVKYVKSFRGEDIGYARFEGVYLPIMWEQSFCIKSPIALGYTRGHFTALVPMEPYANNRDAPDDVTYLPLMDCENKLLPIHFLTRAEMGREEAIMRQWLDVCVTEGGLLVAQQKLRKRPLLVAQMLEEWLNHYRRIAQVLTGPFSCRPPQPVGYFSDGDTDEE